MKKKKWMMMAVMVLALTMMFGTTVYASGKGDVAGAIEGTWQDASAQIKTVVNKVVFPAIDLILAVFFFAKLGLHTLITENTGSLNGRHPQSCLRVWYSR